MVSRRPAFSGTKSGDFAQRAHSVSASPRNFLRIAVNFYRDAVKRSWVHVKLSRSQVSNGTVFQCSTQRAEDTEKYFPPCLCVSVFHVS
jgi:hypothetical protein